MKLLTKMGYSGSGRLWAKRRRKLAPASEAATGEDTVAAGQRHEEGEEAEVERKGIPPPVEVFVCPTSLGLRYGNFTEATKLEANRRIEAEVRGVDLKKQEEERRKEEERRRVEEESLLPGMGALLDGASWRRGAAAAAGRKGRSKKRRRKFVTYEEIAKENDGDGDKKDGSGYKIIDMRGPSAAASTPAVGKDGRVPLGQELLNNLTLLTNSYEDRVRSASHFVHSHKRKVRSLESDVATISRSAEEMTKKAERLERVQSIIDAVERLEEDDSERATDLILELCRTFTAEERKELKVHAAVVLALLGPTVERRLGGWDPLRDGPDAARKAVGAALRMCPDLGGGTVTRNGSGGGGSPSGAPMAEDPTLETRRAMLRSHVLPKMRAAFRSSSSWDPVRDAERGADVYEAALEAAREASQPEANGANGAAGAEADEDVLTEDPFAGLPSRRGGTGETLVNLVEDEILFDAIYPRLSSATDAQSTAVDRMDQVVALVL